MNLSLGQSGFDEVFARLGSLIRIWAWMKTKVKAKMDSVRTIGEGANAPQPDAAANGDFHLDQGTTVVTLIDPLAGGVPNITSCFLFGVKIGTNTDKKGIIYGKYDNADDKVKLYKNAARDEIVGQSGALAAGPEILDIAEQNSSGLTGHIAVNTDPEADQYFQLFPRAV